MKEIVEYFQQKNIIFKSLKEITPKEIGSRKRIGLYVGVDLKGYYVLLMVLEKKSRVLRKEAQELMALHEKIQMYIDSRSKKNTSSSKHRSARMPKRCLKRTDGKFGKRRVLCPHNTKGLRWINYC
jgi:hypothetical protein